MYTEKGNALYYVKITQKPFWNLRSPNSAQVNAEPPRPNTVRRNGFNEENRSKRACVTFLLEYIFSLKKAACRIYTPQKVNSEQVAV